MGASSSSCARVPCVASGIDTPFLCAAPCARGPGENPPSPHSARVLVNGETRRRSYRIHHTQPTRRARTRAPARAAPCPGTVLAATAAARGAERARCPGGRGHQARAGSAGDGLLCMSCGHGWQQRPTRAGRAPPEVAPRVLESGPVTRGEEGGATEARRAGPRGSLFPRVLSAVVHMWRVLEGERA